MPGKMWDEITRTIKIWGWISNSISHYNGYSLSPMPLLKSSENKHIGRLKGTCQCFVNALSLPGINHLSPP